SWTTSTEQQLKNFDVEKSEDGVNFRKIGTVAAAGHSAISTAYSFTDNHPVETNYYRLRMNNDDGTFKQSQVILLHSSNAVQNVWVVNNPFTGFLDLGFAKAGVQARLQLLSATGALLAEKVLASPAGQIRWTLPGNLSRGSYFLKVLIDGRLFVYKVVRQ
ncbi:MAG TPA: T9SS type A sorting domain-containing protein, partial [Flavisolibacter sp.]|nr:T9SS type A sorting domain-containing protein [Flavisolibacter sp.]